MLLRGMVPLLETSSANATHLLPRLSSFKGAKLKQLNRAYTPSVKSPPKLSSAFNELLTPHGPSEHVEAFIRERNLSSSGKKKRLLTPYELSERVEAFCREGKLSEAISIVKEAPLDAQNSIVWGNLIRSIIGREKYQEAYRLFIDMKRRGIRPTSRTFSTLLKGYVRISDWDRFPLQLENVCSVYAQLKQYHRTTSDDEVVEFSNIPYNLLIGIFGKAQQFQKMFDVFNTMPSKGWLAPDIHTFTTLITAIGNRQLTAYSGTPAIDEGDEAEIPTANELAYKNASDAKLIWRQLHRVCKTPDSHSIRAILKPLSRGRPSDQNFAFDIVHEFLGLSRPGEQSIPAKIILHEQTLHAILLACNTTKRYRYTLHYIQQVIDSDHALLLETLHMDMVMGAHAALSYTDPGEAEQALETLQWMLRMQALPRGPRGDGGIGPQIRPTASTYNAIALACQNGGTWSNACRAFEMMTGYSRDQFRGEMHTPPTKGRGQGLRPTARFMTSFIRCAAKTNDLENIRQALNILGHYGLDAILDAEVPNPAELPQKVLRKGANNQLLHFSRLAEALHSVLPNLLESDDYDKTTKMKWKDLLRQAEKPATSSRDSS